MTAATDVTANRSRPSDDRPRFDFSYSGIKTAILRYVETHQMRDSVEQRRRALAEIAKPKLEDIRAHLRQADARSWWPHSSEH